jgi:peptidoglycan L-alanyl-D-glutamate endopeptidase CwlK
MPSFGKTSTIRLETCHAKIQLLMKRVVEGYDCSILEGARTPERQRELFDAKKSKTMNSKHIPKNGFSYALDVVPYPIAWGEKEEKAILDAIKNRHTLKIRDLIMEYREIITRFYHFAGYVKGVADEMDIKIRWGGDWDGDNNFDDQTFHDLPHFELLED